MKDWREIPAKELDRFMARMPRLDRATCWPWPGHRQPNGYGAFTIRLTPGKYGRQVCWLAHRLSYIAHRGSIPEGLTIDHLCRNRACVNPAHMEPVSMQTNSLRGSGVSAINAKKTHCPKGHPLAGVNLIVEKQSDGSHRKCRECKNARRRNGRPVGGYRPPKRPGSCGVFEWEL